MILPIDLHCHSTFSDGMASIVQIEEKCQRENISVMLTDHNEIRGSLKLFSRGKIHTLPSIEAGTKEGLEFLIYFRNPEDIELFYKRAIEPYRRKRFMVQINVRAEEMLSIAKEFDCFISIAHPYGFRKKSLTFHKSNHTLINFVLENIDAIETFNGNNSEVGNSKAQLLFENIEMYKYTVGSDGHNISSIGQVTADFESTSEKLSTDSLYHMLSNSLFVPDLFHNISKFETAGNIALIHSRYFADGGRSLELGIVDELRSLN